MLRAFEVMVGQDIGLLKGLSSDSYWCFRNTVAGCILATDFAKHSSYCKQVLSVPIERGRKISVARILQEKSFDLKLSGKEVYYTYYYI